MENNGELTLDVCPSGRSGVATVTAQLAGEVLAVEKLDLAKSKPRRQFAEVIADGRPGIEAAAVENLLMQEAAKLAVKPEAEPADLAALPEVDASRIVRPERFITPEVSGVTIPTMTVRDDLVVGRWFVYVRWSDGRRERRTLGPTLGLSDGGRLWVHPMPSEPTPNMRPGWSSEARKRWLAGEPAPSPAEVFKRVCERIAYFLDLPRPQAFGITTTLACWVMLTYAYPAWPAAPYLYVGGPLGSGKSRLFEILGRLVFRPLASSNMTAASLFRTLHTRGATLLFDEAERLKNTRDPDVSDILSMLLAGYKAGGSATRLEPTGDGGFKTVSFDVFGPKALACVAGLPPALASRCIPITMFRAPPDSEKPPRRIDAEPTTWQRVRDDLHSLALEHGPTFLELAGRTDVCPEMSGRSYELWQPLLGLASWLEETGALGLVKLVEKHALATIESGRDDQTPDHDETLLRLLAAAIRFGERPTPGEILDKAKNAEPEAFRHWTARAVAAHLKRYGLITNKTDGQKRYARVTLEDLARIQTNYGIGLDIASG